MLRSLFIGLSENKGLRNFAEKSPLGLRFSHRFVAGTHLHDVVQAAPGRQRLGRGRQHRQPWRKRSLTPRRTRAL